MTKTLFPGSTLGIIGDSPNGIMLARAAKKMGYKVVAYSRYEESPTLAEADVRIVGKMNDKLKLQSFAQRCDVVTYESEHVNSEVIKYIAQYTSVPQGTDALEYMQDRLLERAFFEQLNVNIAPYATIVNLDDVYQAVTSIGYPCVLKPIQKGLGKAHQQIIRKQSDIAKCADIIDMGTYILESWIPYTKELSVVLTKDAKRTINFFPVIENIYHDHVLHESLVPAMISNDVEAEVRRLADKIAKSLNYVGTMEIAFFLTESGAIYVKRVVPGLHASGYVFDKATNVTMFEQHLRALAQMPLVKTELMEPTVAITIESHDQDDLRTQWVLKDNWYYNFFRYPLSMRVHDTEGYLLALGPTIETVREQVESTGIWDNKI
ncbi:5-(carboxyamino)imidazole ribonucleotide synthase [Ligilactobacillus sp. 110_WCHN]|uniref:5-(carboxyamino)imidazole ribonucleotide synthase n=1 Tax=Ligilactobacillus sp. 110_WCHN TaxID=3057125 RepID=UPI00267346A2|nr:ATP-grasp domain-containing protein [Ligilactobacillus sp. 110_WCHN]MDO3393104.1 ATP-grasp domain-containing protein [Ligilactobacillus sp. 110_WCHN]